MGGGDLNLKKSWHPSTLRNIERVWKAEQKHDAEQRKIEQLQKELQDERAKEEIRQFAEDHGVVKKKNERLDWMYQGPSALVDREQYLVGRSVDRTFEVLEQLEHNKLPEDNGGQPGAIFGQSSVDVTIDLANKIREDPLFNIKKKETEQKKNLLNNPIKMKQLRDLLELAVSKKDKKKHKKSKKHKRSSEDQEKESRKAKSHRNKERRSKKKEYSDEENSKKSRKHLKIQEIKKRRKNSSESEDASSSSDSPVDRVRSYARQATAKRHSSGSSDEDRPCNVKTKGEDEMRRYRDGSRIHQSHYSKPYGLIFKKNTQNTDSRPRLKAVPRRSRSKSPVAKKVARAISPPRRKLTNEEMEEKRRKMMEDAKWRDEQRERNVKRYKREEEKDDQQKGKAVDFIRPMLSAATDSGSVESRIRQKMFNLQRSSSAMNENFARK